MLNYAIFLQTDALLLEISSLTSKLYLTSGSFCAACINYFKKVQDFADAHKLYFASDVAIATQKLITYKGDAEVNGARVSPKKNLRKEKDSFAVKCLETVMKEIKIFLEKDRKTYEECSEIWRQVVARLLCKNQDLNTVNAHERADVIMCQVAVDAELLPYYSHVIGLLGVFNARAVLDTVLPQLNFL